MSAPAAQFPPAERAWSWPVAEYDRGRVGDPGLALRRPPRQVRGATTGALRRLLRPIEDVLAHVGAYPDLWA